MATPPLPPTPLESSEPGATRPVPNLEFKAAVLLLFTLLLVAGSVLYLLHARGLFEPTQSLVLVTDDAEGVVVGMEMTFAGFPIGRVRRVELAPTGDVHILVDVPRRDAHWLRTSSVFTLVRGLVGGTTIRAFSGVLTDPPLADGAQRPALRGDATADLPRVLASAREALTANSEAMKKVVGELTSAGIDPKDIQTSAFRVEPRYTRPAEGQAPKIDGYSVTNEVQVLVRDLEKVGDILDRLVTAGANQSSGLSFEVSKAETALDEARKQAVANARRRAELYAAAAGAEVGEVLTITEGDAAAPPQPVFARAMKAATAEAQRAAGATRDAASTCGDAAEGRTFQR